MDLTIHNEVVYQIDHFLSDEELSELNNIINNAPKDKQSWTLNQDLPDVEENVDTFWSGKLYRVGYLPIFETIRDRVQDLFNFCATATINGIGDIARTLPEDTPMDFHTDIVGWPKIKYGVVIYINDDYSGGEICYPDFDLKLKPTAGMIAIHPSTLEHGVAPVGGSPRYMMTTFINCDHIDEPCELSIKKLV